MKNIVLSTLLAVACMACAPTRTFTQYPDAALVQLDPQGKEIQDLTAEKAPLSYTFAVEVQGHINVAITNRGDENVTLLWNQSDFQVGTHGSSPIQQFRSNPPTEETLAPGKVLRVRLTPTKAQDGSWLPASDKKGSFMPMPFFFGSQTVILNLTYQKASETLKHSFFFRFKSTSTM